MRHFTFAVATLLGLAGPIPALTGSAAARAAGEPRVGPVRSLLEMRQEKVVVQRWDLSCGAAALATIMRYQYNESVSEKQVAIGMLHRDEYLSDPSSLAARGGFSMLDMKRFVDRRGYQGIGYGGLKLQDLIKISPVIVPVVFFGYPHFVVFRGVYQHRVLLADSGYGNRTMPIAEFEQAWQENLGFVVRQRGHSSPSNQLTADPDEFLVPAAAAIRAAALQ